MPASQPSTNESSDHAGRVLSPEMVSAPGKVASSSLVTPPAPLAMPQPRPRTMVEAMLSASGALAGSLPSKDVFDFEDEPPARREPIGPTSKRPAKDVFEFEDRPQVQRVAGRLAESIKRLRAM